MFEPLAVTIMFGLLFATVLTWVLYRCCTPSFIALDSRTSSMREAAAK